MGLKKFCPSVLQNSVRDAKCPGFLQNIKIHFWPRVRTFRLSVSGTKHLQQQQHSHQQDSNMWNREGRGRRVDWWLYRVWTETAKGGERMCREKSVCELSAQVWILSVTVRRSAAQHGLRASNFIMYITWLSGTAAFERASSLCYWSHQPAGTHFRIYNNVIILLLLVVIVRTTDPLKMRQSWNVWEQHHKIAILWMKRLRAD